MPCPDVRRRPAEARRRWPCTSTGENISEVGELSIRECGATSSPASSSATATADRRAGPQGGQRAAAVPARRRPRLPDPQPARGHAGRRRGAAHPPRLPDRQRAGRRAVRARRAVDRPAPARQPAADRDADPAARPRQHRARRRARRGDDPGRRPHRRHRSGRGRARRRGRRQGTLDGSIAEQAQSVTGQYLVGRAAIAVPERRREPGELAQGAGRARAQPAQHRRRDSRSAASSRSPACRAAASRTLVNDILLPVADAARSTSRKDVPGRTRRVEGIEQLDKVIDIDQSPIGRTPRSNPATYTGVFDQVRKLFAATPEAKVRGYQPGRFSFNVQGRSLRGVRGRRHDQDRDALPARRVRAVRGVQGRALQPRHARRHVQGQEHRRGARHAVEEAVEFFENQPRSPGTCRRSSTSASATCGSGSRRPRCRAARRSGSSWRPSWRSARPARRSTSSTSRPPGCTSRTSAGCSGCCSGWSTRATRSS